MAVTTHNASPKAPAQPTQEEPLAPHVKMTLKGHEERVYDVAFICGTRLLVTGSYDKSLRVWDLDTGKQVGEPLLGHDAAVWSVAASPDGRWIVSGGGNGSILVWEVATDKTDLKREPISFEGHGNTGRISGVVFAPDSETFASASWVDDRKTVCVWKRETGQIVLGPLKAGNEANSVSYSPDGKKLAAGTNNHIIVWNTKTGEELLKIEQRAWQVAFTPDGLRLVSGYWQDIRISDATTGDIIKQLDTPMATQFFYSLSIAPNGTKFATTSWDKTTQFFDMTAFEPIGEPLEHPDIVWGLAFSEDNKLIATSCMDKLVRTWTVPLSESEKELQQETIPDLPSQDDELPPRFFDDVNTSYPPRRSNHLPYGVLQHPAESAQQSRIMALVNRLPFRRQSQQAHPSAEHLHPRRAPIPTSTFFDDFDPHSPPGRNNHAATATRHAEGSKINNMMNRLFSRSSAPQGHAPRPRRIPLVDVFATRGKYRTANAHTGKRHKLMQLQRPPRQQAHAASSSSAPPPATSNVVDETTPATLQTGSTSATHRPPSPFDVEHVPDTSCFAVLTRCFPRLSRTSAATPRPR